MLLDRRETSEREETKNNPDHLDICLPRWTIYAGFIIVETLAGAFRNEEGGSPVGY